MKDETVWLNAEQMAELFDRDSKTIRKHIQNALKEELDDSTVSNFATVQKEGERFVTRNIEYYNLDMIISVGYRVKSQKGVVFRKWANEVLKEYLLKGVAINKNRLEYLEKTVQLVDIAHRVDSSSKELKDILSVIHTYSNSLGLLDDYDHRVLEKKKGYVSDEIVTLDGNNIGNVKAGGSLTMDVPIGKHVINVNTVGMYGNGNSVDGTQIDVTEDMGDIIIDIGFKYNMLTEISGQTQECSIFSIDYGNNRVDTFKKRSSLVFNKHKWRIIYYGVGAAVCFLTGLFLGPAIFCVLALVPAGIAWYFYHLDNKQ